MATNDGRLSDLLRAGEPDRAAFVTAETGEASRTASSEGGCVARRPAGDARRRSGQPRRARRSRTGPTSCSSCSRSRALGATAAPLNPAYKRDEYGFYLDDLAARAAARRRPASCRRPARPPATASASSTSRPTAARGARASAAAAVERERAFERGRARRRRAAPAHERHDEPPEAGAAAAAEPDGLGADDRRVLRARPATTSRTARCRSSTCTGSSPRPSARSRAAARSSCRGGSRRAAFWPQLRSHGVTWFSAGPTLHR